MTEQDLDIVADALVALSQTPSTAAHAVAVSQPPPPSGRSRRERKLPAKLTSGDFVCEVGVTKEPVHAGSSLDGIPPHAYDVLDSLHTNSASIYRHAPFKRKQPLSAANQLEADTAVFYRIAKKLRGLEDETDNQDYIHTAKKTGKRHSAGQPTIVQVFAGSVPDDADGDLLAVADSMYVWDANMYIVPRCPAVRGPLKSTNMVGIGTH